MVEIYVSKVIDAPADQVWAVIRDFNALPDWVPIVTRSRIEEGRASDQVGCIRAFDTSDGGFIREQLLALSDFDLSFTYAILESPMGVQNYVATVKLTPVTETDQCFAEWSAEFDCAPGREAELHDQISQDVFAAGLEALNAKLGAAA